MSIQNRLHMILKMHNISAASFADSIGVQRSNVSHVLSGRNKPSLDFLEKILLTYSRVNASWLITGKMPVDNGLDFNNELNQLKKNDGSDLELNSILSDSNNLKNPNKELEKIVLFYTDKSFEIYNSSK